MIFPQNTLETLLEGADVVTIIPDGDDQARTSAVDGETFVLAPGDETTVAGAPVVTFADDGVAFLDLGIAEATGATPAVDIDGDHGLLAVFAPGVLAAEETGVDVAGDDATVANDGLIAGGLNGVRFLGEDGRLENLGRIESDSRAVEIIGTDTEVVNLGDILGTGDQRNGTVYANATAEGIVLENREGGRIDAGFRNDGAGVSFEIGDEAGDTVSAEIVNQGAIAGRGDAPLGENTRGDGLRLFAGAPDAEIRGTILNGGEITSDDARGIEIRDGLGFDGRIVNEAGGAIFGETDGLYFGDAGHDARVRNSGTIASDSRAVNIDGSGVDLRNEGLILGTGDQRNGTVYSDATAEDFGIVNAASGVIDAGAMNDGSGIALQIGDVAGDTVEARLVNLGTILGRGDETGNAQEGDAIRVFGGSDEVTTLETRLVNRGTLEGTDDGIEIGAELNGGAGLGFVGDIVNTGSILAGDDGIDLDANTAFTGDIVNRGTIEGGGDGISIGIGADGSFVGDVVNAARGAISGTVNGINVTNVAEGPRIVNAGTIESASRAVNIDGTDTDLVNRGDILGTGDQRNGTVYANSSAEDYTITNAARGVIDAGRGNDGSGVSLQTGDTDGDVVSASLVNRGRIEGRGDASEGNTVGDGVRLFSDVEDAVFEGDVVNTGLIRASADSDAAVGLRIEDGVALDGEIVNRGSLVASEVAIDATGAGGGLDVVNRGFIAGDVLLSEGDDRFEGASGRVVGAIDGGGGHDEIVGGRSRDEISGGAGDDTLTGGEGRDTFVFAPNDAPSADTITDFAVGTDRIDVTAFDFFDFGDIGVAQAGDDTLLTFASDNTATLLDVDAETLGAGDFLV
ncbi:MAG: hypothetical protein ACFBWO_05435 [Paracoccaceae bacterium]